MNEFGSLLFDRELPEWVVCKPDLLPPEIIVKPALAIVPPPIKANRELGPLV